MKKGKYSTPRHSLRGTGVLALMLALALAVGGITGGTIAWLTAKTPTISNTFVVGNIGLELTESSATTASKDENNIVVPGQTFTKDTKVTVKANSVKCYLFLRIDENHNVIPDKATKKIIDWEFDNDENGWTKLGATSYYYLVVNPSTTDTTFKLVKGDKLTVNTELTKEQIDKITTNPTLSFSAAAVQFDAIPTTDDVAHEQAAFNLLPADFKKQSP